MLIEELLRAAALVLAGIGGPAGVALEDSADAADPRALWGAIDCETPARHRHVETGGDPLPIAADARPDEAFRRLSVRDGDDADGERCELGLNDHRVSPVAVYEEGERWVTSLSLRLGDDFPLGVQAWQTVVQMKQSQPSANGDGTPVLELDAYGDRWRLRQSDSSGPASDSRELWSVPASVGDWTRFVFDVTYSNDPGVGRAIVAVDLDGDGALDRRSPTFSTYTLKSEVEGGDDDGIAPGEAIPSHLRVGIYHDPSIPCRGSDCAIDIDSVQVREHAAGASTGLSLGL